MLFGRWQVSHFSWKIGATSFVNVTVFAESAAATGSDDTRRALNPSAIETRNITGSFQRLADAGAAQRQSSNGANSIGHKALFCTPESMSSVVTLSRPRNYCAPDLDEKIGAGFTPSSPKTRRSRATNLGSLLRKS